jgi:hypothetical protein
MACSHPAPPPTADPSGTPSDATSGAPAPSSPPDDATPAAAPLPEAKVVLAEAVQALGGADRLAAVTSYHSQAKLRIEAQDLSAEIRTWWKDGDFYVENEMAGVGLTQLWKHGDEIWAQDPINGKRRLEGPEAAQTAWSASLSIAADWSRYFDTATTIARREDGGVELVDVQLLDARGNTLTLSFDADSKLLVQQRFVQHTPMGDIPVHITMDDYRSVDGVQTSFRSVTNMSVVEAVQTLETFETNVEIDVSKFTPP